MPKNNNAEKNKNKIPNKKIPLTRSAMFQLEDFVLNEVGGVFRTNLVQQKSFINTTKLDHKNEE